MAATGKKGKKFKGQTMDVNAFLEHPLPTNTNWADIMENETNAMQLKTEILSTRSQLPSEPRQSRGPISVDESQVPHYPPFESFVSNISFDADQRSIEEFFQCCGCRFEVKLLADSSSGRNQGRAYIRFDTREGLIEALKLDQQKLLNREIRVSVHTNQRQGGRSGFSNFGRQDGRPESDTGGNWRSGPRSVQPGPPPQQHPPPQTYDAPDYAGGRQEYYGGAGQQQQFQHAPQQQRIYENRSPPQHQAYQPPQQQYGGGGGGNYNNYNAPRGNYGNQQQGYGSMNRREPGGRMYGDGGYNDYGGGGGGRYYNQQQQYHEPDGYNRGGGYGGYARQTEWRNGGGYQNQRPTNRGYYSGGGGGYPPQQQDYQHQQQYAPRQRTDSQRSATQESEQQLPAERPKLLLKKRSVPLKSEDEPAPTTKSSIFGGAKPVDTTERELEVERKLLMQERSGDGVVVPTGGPAAAPLRVDTGGRRTSERTISQSSGSHPPLRSPKSPPVTAENVRLAPHVPPPQEHQQQQHQEYDDHSGGNYNRGGQHQPNGRPGGRPGGGYHDRVFTRGGGRGAPSGRPGGRGGYNAPRGGYDRGRAPRGGNYTGPGRRQNYQAPGGARGGARREHQRPPRMQQMTDEEFEQAVKTEEHNKNDNTQTESAVEQAPKYVMPTVKDEPAPDFTAENRFTNLTVDDGDDDELD